MIDTHPLDEMWIPKKPSGNQNMVKVPFSAPDPAGIPGSLR